MGFLDGSTITVDAILTKQGRKLLSEGQGLNIKYFALTDTGIDYTLWNTGHPSGSAYYGEAIENLPQLEANPNGVYSMRNHLVTLNKTTTRMPYVSLFFNQWDFGAVTDIESAIAPTLMHHAETEGWWILVPDDSILNFPNATQVDIAGNAFSFLAESDIPNAAMYERPATGDNASDAFLISPKIVTADKQVTCTVISKTTGAYTTFVAMVSRNDTPQQSSGATSGTNTNPGGPM